MSSPPQIPLEKKKILYLIIVYKFLLLQGIHTRYVTLNIIVIFVCSTLFFKDEFGTFFGIFYSNSVGSVHYGDIVRADAGTWTLDDYVENGSAQFI